MTIQELKKKMFAEQMAKRASGRCAKCGKVMAKEIFKDAISRREFEITGYCQECQDEFFSCQ